MSHNRDNLEQLLKDRNDRQTDYDSVVTDLNNDLSDGQIMEDPERADIIYKRIYDAQQPLITAAEYYSQVLNNLVIQNEATQAEKEAAIEARNYLHRIQRVRNPQEIEGGRRHRKSSSRRASSRSSKKRTTKRKLKRRQRSAYRRRR